MPPPRLPTHGLATCMAVGTSLSIAFNASALLRKIDTLRPARSDGWARTS